METTVTEQGPEVPSPPAAAAPATTAPLQGSIPRFFRNIWVLTKKELNIYFSTPLAYVILGVFVFMMGYFFFTFIYRYQDISMRTQQIEQFQPGALERLNFTDLIFAPHFGTASILYVFMIPFLTMRLLADEKKHNTYSLLMTSPIRPWEIVLGKFLSVQIVLTISLVLTFTYPGLLNLIAASGGVEWQTAASVYLGLFLMTAAYASLGLFVSALTESSIIAALVTFFMVLLPLHLLAGAGSSTEGVKKELLEYVCSSTHLQGFLTGSIRLADITYFISVTILGLVLTRTAIERTRW